MSSSEKTASVETGVVSVETSTVVAPILLLPSTVGTYRDLWPSRHILLAFASFLES